MVEREWQLEIQGELTKQRRIEAIDKLLSVLTLIVASVFGLQAIGLDGVPFVCRPDWLQTRPATTAIELSASSSLKAGNRKAEGTLVTVLSGHSSCCG